MNIIKRFFDIESDEIITTDQLYKEYSEKLLTGEIDPMLFSEFVFNSLTLNNGTLEII